MNRLDPFEGEDEDDERDVFDAQQPLLQQEQPTSTEPQVSYSNIALLLDLYRITIRIHVHSIYM